PEAALVPDPGLVRLRGPAEGEAVLAAPGMSAEAVARVGDGAAEVAAHVGLVADLGDGDRVRAPIAWRHVLDVDEARVGGRRDVGRAVDARSRAGEHGRGVVL